MREEKRQLEQWLDELPLRNADNVSRTASYLDLYAHTRRHPPELPWLLMAHLVSRNGGYLMSDTAGLLQRREGFFKESALTELFLFLERANFLIFYDAWYHVLHHLLGRSREMDASRVTRYMRARWSAYERDAVKGVTPELERRLVQELVVNEQNLIEHRVVHSAEYRVASAMVAFFESIERDAPLVFPVQVPPIKVGTFGLLARRIETGHRIFDVLLRDPEQRARCFEWAVAHPHTGSRAVYGGRPTPAVRDAWPRDRVRSLSASVHRPLELFQDER